MKLLKQHSKVRTPVGRIAKLMKRSEGSPRQKALKLGIGLGHQRSMLGSSRQLLGVSASK
ncbi:hypothetical protein ACE103_09770 [Bradyrhizobium sp. ma5]|uniref:hypothetical protein n=1 Tax=Bradyrhizobium sp. ma5 TaxID=3344828 RepID=UPI0035D3E5D7